MTSLIQQFDLNHTVLSVARTSILNNPQFDFNNFYDIVHDPKIVKARDRDNKINALEASVIAKLSSWKHEKNPSTDPLNFNTVQDKTALFKKIKIIKVAIAITVIASLILVAIALILLPLHFFAASSLLYPIQLTSASAFLCFQIGNIIPLFTKNLFRQVRVNCSKNFQEFIQKYMVEKLQFVPSQADLIDSKLHEVYCDWKVKSKSILEL